MIPLPIIDEVSIVAPFGVCFHDTATGQRITDGLSVAVYPATAGKHKHRTHAFPNRVGVYVLHKIAGLENLGNARGDAEFWDNNPPQKLYTVEVSDNEKRFQSFQFDVRLPVRGLYQWENLPLSSPNKNLTSVPLYSASTRRNSGGMSVIRAQLRETGGLPAARAVLEAHFNGNLVARGLADDDGQIALIFPTLPPETDPFASPPGTATRVALAEQKWVLDLTVKYQPGIFQTSPPGPTEGSDGGGFPDLRLALTQANGTLWADGGQTEEYKTAVLPLGRELILRSRKAGILSPPDAGTPLSSFLFVSPAI